MESIKSFMKDYGAAVGPTLAFVLGIITVISKWASRVPLRYQVP